MYLGLDFLISPGEGPLLIEVNVGLPGGAQEYDFAHRVYRGGPSGIFERIEALSAAAYGLPFKAYVDSLPFLDGLKALKLWMDGQGPFPDVFHPALRLEDKWVQYRLLSPLVAMPLTVPLEPGDPSLIRAFLSARPKAVLKRRTGRGGRGLVVVDHATDLAALPAAPFPGLLQEHVDSRVERFSVSIRSVAFAGEPVAMYANLAERPTSNHGLLAFVIPGTSFSLTEHRFAVRSFNERSWEAAIWFGADPSRDPAYLRHNLNEDLVITAALTLPADVYAAIRATSVLVERTYEALDPASLPPAWFEPGPV